MSLPNPSKRRRLDNALHKPFRSPLKDPSSSKQQTVIPSTLPADLDKPKTNIPLPSILNPEVPDTTQPTTTPINSSESPINSSDPPSLPTPPNPSSISSTFPPSLHTLQSLHTHLHTTLLRLKSNVETSNQALAIECNPTREAELTRLIEKWRKASRAAAEEIFAGARDKVNRMGGVRGMIQREREAKERNWGWEDGGGGDGSGDEGGEDGEGIENEHGLEEEKEQEGDGEEVDEEGGYTMDMMLKSMGIELGVIGFDKRLQRWED